MKIYIKHKAKRRVFKGLVVQNWNEKTFLFSVFSFSSSSVYPVYRRKNPINICFDVLKLIWCYVTQSGFEIATEIILMQIIYRKKCTTLLVYVFILYFLLRDKDKKKLFIIVRWVHHFIFLWNKCKRLLI